MRPIFGRLPFFKILPPVVEAGGAVGVVEDPDAGSAVPGGRRAGKDRHDVDDDGNDPEVRAVNGRADDGGARAGDAGENGTGADRRGTAAAGAYLLYQSNIVFSWLPGILIFYHYLCVL